MLMKIWGHIYYAWERHEFAWWEDNKEMTTVHWGALYYTLKESDKNYIVHQSLRVSVDEKTKSNLKLLKDKTLKLIISCCSILCFFLIDYAFFSLTYVLVINTLKLTTTFLSMKPVMLKFQILTHGNDFRIDCLFWRISVKFSEKNW